MAASTCSPVYATSGLKVVALGSPASLSLLGNQDTSEPNSIGIIPPCKSGNDSLAGRSDSLMCIKSFKSRVIGSQVWANSSLVSSDILDYVESMGVTKSTFTNYGFTRIGSTDSWRASGGSASIWQLEDSSLNGSKGSKFLIEGAVSNQSKTKFSLSIVPLSALTYENSNLNSKIKSKLSRIDFPKNVEYQVIIAMGYHEQPLLWMTSTTLSGSATKKFGPPEYIFEGQPQQHGILTKNITNCVDEFNQIDLQLLCERSNDPVIEVRPSDAAILRYLSDEGLIGFVESSRVEEWSFQNGDTENNANNYSMFVGDTQFSCPMPLALMSTNASVFSFVAPEWNAKTGQLKFKVANSHLDRDGNLSRGVFAFSLDYWTASCMWNLSGSTNKAEVQIVSDDGSYQNIFTSVVRMDSVSNKAQIFISGFEFSAPKISIKLIDMLQTSSGSNLQFKKTITCVKGKVSKKVTGLSPACPKGFRKQI